MDKRTNGADGWSGGLGLAVFCSPLVKGVFKGTTTHDLYIRWGFLGLATDHDGLLDIHKGSWVYGFHRLDGRLGVWADG